MYPIFFGLCLWIKVGASVWDMANISILWRHTDSHFILCVGNAAPQQVKLKQFKQPLQFGVHKALLNFICKNYTPVPILLWANYGTLKLGTRSKNTQFLCETRGAEPQSRKYSLWLAWCAGMRRYETKQSFNNHCIWLMKYLSALLW
jgi:hypothetical protein